MVKLIIISSPEGLFLLIFQVLNNDDEQGNDEDDDDDGDGDDNVNLLGECGHINRLDLPEGRQLLQPLPDHHHDNRDIDDITQCHPNGDDCQPGLLLDSDDKCVLDIAVLCKLLR